MSLARTLKYLDIGNLCKQILLELGEDTYMWEVKRDMEQHGIKLEKSKARMKKAINSMTVCMTEKAATAGEREGGAQIHMKGNLKLIEAMKQRNVRLYLQLREEEKYGWQGSRVTCEWCTTDEMKTAKHVIMECTGTKHKEARDDIERIAREIMKTDKKERSLWEAICNPGYYGLRGKEIDLGETTANLLEKAGYGWAMEDQN